MEGKRLVVPLLLAAVGPPGSPAGRDGGRRGAGSGEQGRGVGQEKMPEELDAKKARPGVVSS